MVEFLTHTFGFFFTFSQKLPSQSETLISIERTRYGKRHCISGYAQILLHQKFWPSKESNFQLPCISCFDHFYFAQKDMALGKVKSINFLSFLKLFDFFFEKYPSKSEILISLGRTGFGKLTCISGGDQFFYAKCYGPRNNQVFDFQTVFFVIVFLVFSRKLPSQ